VDWIHKASSTIYDDLNGTKCNSHVGGYYAEKKQIWFSWAGVSENCPSKTFIIGTEFPFASYLDHGFTAFLNYRPFVMESLRGFLKDKCICTEAELDTYGGNFGADEGGFCDNVAEADASCPTRPTSIYSLAGLEIGEDKTVEDYSGPADALSFFTLYNSLTVSDLCTAEWRAAECDAQYVWTMASASDQCIKELREDSKSRRQCTDTLFCGTYVDLGYKSVLRSGPNAFSIPNIEKVINGMSVEAHVISAGNITLRIGSSVQALDPNLDNSKCNIFWQTQDPKDLKCLQNQIVAQFNRQNISPSEDISWALYATGKYLYYELTVDNPTANPVDTGVDACLSRISLDVARRDR